VRKSINFCRTVKMEILGLIENMSTFTRPYCGKAVDTMNKGRLGSTIPGDEPAAAGVTQTASPGGFRSAGMGGARRGGSRGRGMDGGGGMGRYGSGRP